MTDVRFETLMNSQVLIEVTTEGENSLTLGTGVVIVTAMGFLLVEFKELPSLVDLPAIVDLAFISLVQMENLGL